MAREDTRHNEDAVDLLLDMFENTAVPDFVIASFGQVEPEDFDITDFFVDAVSHTGEKCALVRDAVKETKDARMQKLFNVFPLDQRKQMLDDEYRGALVDLSRLAGPDGRVLIPSNLTPQNWNGNRYQGPNCINLQLRMATHPGWLPVFATSDQARAIGVQKKMTAEGCSVVYKYRDESQRFRHLAWNIEDLDFATRHPRHIIAFREKFADRHELPLTRTAMDLVLQDGRGRSVEDVVRDLVRATDAPGQRPRFSSSSIPATERAILRNLVEDLAVMSICTRLRATSHVRTSDIMAFRSHSFTVAYPFHAVLTYAGKITMDLDRKLGLFNKRGLDMDSVSNRVNRELEKEQMNRSTRSLKK